MKHLGRGFTLLEVLVAVSILGLGLTVILSSQASLFATANRSEKISVATSLARCRMNSSRMPRKSTQRCESWWVKSGPEYSSSRP